MSKFLKSLHESLLPFEILLLYLGLILFLIFIGFAIRSLIRNIKIHWTYFGILVFSIVMIAFPSVTSIGIQNDGNFLVEFNRKIESGEEPISEQQIEEAQKVATRISKSKRSYPDHTIYASAVTLKNVEQYDLAKVQLSKVPDKSELIAQKSGLSKTLQILEASHKLEKNPDNGQLKEFI